LLFGLSLAAVACGPQVAATIRESTRPPQYDPVRVFRNSAAFFVGDFSAALDTGAVVTRLASPVQVATTDAIPWIPIQAAQETTNARPCEYWRVAADGRTVTGPGIVRIDRCVPRESSSSRLLVAVGPVPANAAPCDHWEVISPDSVITLQRVVAIGRCGPPARPVFIEIPPGVP
jgi:hypothetical protein